MLGTSIQVPKKRSWKVVVSWDNLCKPTVCKPFFIRYHWLEKEKKYAKPKSANFQSMTQHVKRLSAMNNQVLVIYPFASTVSTNNREILNFHKTFWQHGMGQVSGEMTLQSNDCKGFGVNSLKYFKSLVNTVAKSHKYILLFLNWTFRIILREVFSTTNILINELS